MVYESQNKIGYIFVFQIFCALFRIADLYKVFVRSKAPTTWPRNSIRHWPLKRSNFLSLPVPSKRRCRRQTFALYWPIHGQGQNPWFSRFWIGDRLLFPQIAILKLKIKQNEFLYLIITLMISKCTKEVILL